MPEREFFWVARLGHHTSAAIGYINQKLSLSLT